MTEQAPQGQVGPNLIVATRSWLAAAGGRVYVSGLDPDMADLLAQTESVSLTAPVQSFDATPTLGRVHLGRPP